MNSIISLLFSYVLLALGIGIMIDDANRDTNMTVFGTFLFLVGVILLSGTMFYMGYAYGKFKKLK